MRRVRFVAAYPRKRALEIGIELPARQPNIRFRRIESYTRYMHGHYLVIENENQLDSQVQRWLRESYRVGTQMAPRLPRRNAKKTY